MTTTPLNPKAARQLLNEAGIHTSYLDIATSSHGVLITTLTSTPSDAKLITDVHTVFHLAGYQATRRSPYAIKIHNPRRPRR